MFLLKAKKKRGTVDEKEEPGGKKLHLGSVGNVTQALEVPECKFGILPVAPDISDGSSILSQAQLVQVPGSPFKARLLHFNRQPRSLLRHIVATLKLTAGSGHHPNIARLWAVHRLGDKFGQKYAIQLVDKAPMLTLGSWLRPAAAAAAVPNPGQRVQLLYQLVRALAKCHSQQIFHNAFSLTSESISIVLPSAEEGETGPPLLQLGGFFASVFGTTLSTLMDFDARNRVLMWGADQDVAQVWRSEVRNQAEFGMPLKAAESFEYGMATRDLFLLGVIVADALLELKAGQGTWRHFLDTSLTTAPTISTLLKEIRANKSDQGLEVWELAAAQLVWRCCNLTESSKLRLGAVNLLQDPLWKQFTHEIAEVERSYPVEEVLHTLLQLSEVAHLQLLSQPNSRVTSSFESTSSVEFSDEELFLRTYQARYHHPLSHVIENQLQSRHLCPALAASCAAWNLDLHVTHSPGPVSQTKIEGLAHSWLKLITKLLPTGAIKDVEEWSSQDIDTEIQLVRVAYLKFDHGGVDLISPLHFAYLSLCQLDLSKLAEGAGEEWESKRYERAVMAREVKTTADLLYIASMSCSNETRLYRTAMRVGRVVAEAALAIWQLPGIRDEQELRRVWTPVIEETKKWFSYEPSSNNPLEPLVLRKEVRDFVQRQAEGKSEEKEVVASSKRGEGAVIRIPEEEEVGELPPWSMPPEPDALREMRERMEQVRLVPSPPPPADQDGCVIA